MENCQLTIEGDEYLVTFVHILETRLCGADA